MNQSEKEDNFFKWMRGGLSENEWKELVALEYVLTWNYNEVGDEHRYRILSDRCWAGRDAIKINLNE